VVVGAEEEHLMMVKEAAEEHWTEVMVVVEVRLNVAKEVVKVARCLLKGVEVQDELKQGVMAEHSMLEQKAFLAVVGEVGARLKEVRHESRSWKYLVPEVVGELGLCLVWAVVQSFSVP
jgi:hypothetical protein